jgi:hypothetical protein
MYGAFSFTWAVTRQDLVTGQALELGRYLSACQETEVLK